MLENIERGFEKIFDVEYIPKNQRKRQKRRLLELVNDSQERILVVAGELSPRDFDDKFPNIIKKKLEYNNNLQIELLFSKSDNGELITEDQFIERVSQRNPNLTKVLKEYPDRIKMYWAKRRPRYHFGIYDNNLFLEDIHKPGEAKMVRILINKQEKVNDYLGYLDIMKNASIIELIADNNRFSSNNDAFNT
jgi:hypothetical protein